jgi:hypothetical protein
MLGLAHMIFSPPGLGGLAFQNSECFLVKTPHGINQNLDINFVTVMLFSRLLYNYYTIGMT